jgi:hypothetical protein
MSAVQQPGQSINDKEQLGQQTLSRRASYPCENYEVGKKGLGKRSMGDRQDTLGTSVVVDGSFVSSLSSDHSVEESSFRQLQGAVSQVHGYFLPSLHVCMVQEVVIPYLQPRSFIQATRTLAMGFVAASMFLHSCHNLGLNTKSLL